MEEESQFDWNAQAVPLRVCQPKVFEETRGAGNPLVLRAELRVEKNGAGIASAKELVAVRLDQVLVAS